MIDLNPLNKFIITGSITQPEPLPRIFYVLRGNIINMYSLDMES